MSYNSDIDSWTDGTKKEAKGKFDELDIQHVARSPSPSPSKNNITHRNVMRQGEISKIALRFPRHMIFVHQGLGGDTPKGKAGSTNRKAKEWLTPVLDSRIELLADIVANNAADVAINGLGI